MRGNSLKIFLREEDTFFNIPKRKGNFFGKFLRVQVTFYKYAQFFQKFLKEEERKSQETFFNIPEMKGNFSGKFLRGQETFYKYAKFFKKFLKEEERKSLLGKNKLALSFKLQDVLSLFAVPTFAAKLIHQRDTQSTSSAHFKNVQL